MELQIHQMLREKRKELKLTQEDVANNIFVSKRTVSNWETGKTFPDIDSLIRLAEYYDFSLDNLLLEGAPIVEDIKTKAEIQTIKKLALPPLLTNLCLIIMLISQKWWGTFSSPVLLLISISIFSNFFPLYYFRNKVNRNKVYNLNKLNSIITIVFIISITIISVILILLIPKIMSY